MKYDIIWSNKNSKTQFDLIDLKPSPEVNILLGLEQCHVKLTVSRKDFYSQLH